MIAIFAPLIAPDEPARPGNFATPLGPSWQPPLRHRRARPRRLQPRHLRRARHAADRRCSSSRSRRRSAARSARSPATSAGRSTALFMRAADLVFAFPPIILAMVVAAVLGRSLENAALAIVVVAWPVLRPRRARARAHGRRLRVRAVGAPARGERAAGARSGTCSRTSIGPGARPDDARPRQRDPAALGALVPRPRRPAAAGRVGLDGRRRGRSTSSGGGSARSRASRSSPSCSPSTSSATACATSSTRAPGCAARRAP